MTKLCDVEEEKKKYGKFENHEIEWLAEKFIDVENCRKNEPEKFKYVLERLKELKSEKNQEIKSIDDLVKARQDLGKEEKEDADS